MVSVMGKRGLFLVWLCLVSILPGMAQTEKLIDYVNPFVGTDGYGNVYPGAQIPFGGIQMSPDTDSKYYDAASGDRKSTRLNSSHNRESRMPSSA